MSKTSTIAMSMIAGALAAAAGAWWLKAGGARAPAPSVARTVVASTPESAPAAATPVASSPRIAHPVPAVASASSQAARTFELETRRDVLLDGRPAVELVFQWDSGTGMIKQRQIYSLLPDGRSITIVNTAPTPEFAAVDPQFIEMLNSFGWAPPPPATE